MTDSTVNIEADGWVMLTERRGEGMVLHVRLDEGQTITCTMTGLQTMRCPKARGDRVTVAVSPYDLTHGRIVTRSP